MSSDFEIALRRSWDSHSELVFPQEPVNEARRYFLRTEHNPNADGHLVFIGINPSKATRFARNNKRDGGDHTTAAILERFPLQEGKNFPSDYAMMTIINLVPLVGQPEQSKGRTLKLPTWSSDEGRREIEDSIRETKEVFKVIVPTATHIILCWGKHKTKSFPWKPSIISHILPILKKYIPVDAKVEMIQSANSPFFPVHPAYKHWHVEPRSEAFKPFVSAVPFLHNESKF